MFRNLLVSLLFGGLLITHIDSALAQSKTAPLAAAPLAKRVHGEEALQTLGGRIREVAEFHRMKETELRELFQRDKSLWVDQQGRLYYVCEFKLPPKVEGPVGESTNTPVLNPLYALDQTFKLHSRPGASRVIYLDFDGHDASTTVWGGTLGTVPMARPFDTDGNPYTFSGAERTSIQYIWSRVAEDYLQYDIDVTTEEPPVGVLINSGTGRYGVRVGIGGDSSDWYGSAGGVAYLNSFDDNQDLPCWVFPKSLGDDEKNIAEACSHEAGHTLGLSHDGRTSPVEDYYTGHGNWAPIMGVGYSKSIVQWSQGEYTSANNAEDDLTRMLSFGAINRTDDYGNDIATAAPLTGVKPFTWGIISTRTDVDFFSFEIGAGRTTITASPAPRGPNLHILLSLYNSAGSLITSSDVADSASTGTLPVTISMILPAGKYYVSVDGIGVGTGSTGYTDYSSLGQYTLALTLPSDAAWTMASGGARVWTNVANWSSNTVPFGLSAIARLNNNIGGDQNILIDTPVRIGGLLLGDADAAQTFTIEASGAGVLQLGVTNGSAWINKIAGANDVISAPLTLLANLMITNAAVADLVLSGDLSGAYSLTKYGAGRLVLAGNDTATAGLVVGGGTVALADTAVISSVAGIMVGNGATFDVSASSTGWFVAPNQVLSGFGVVTGDVSTTASARLVPGAGNTVGTLSFADQLMLTNGTILDFNLTSVTNVGDGINDLIAVAGDLILDGVITVNFNHGLTLPTTEGSYAILTYGGTLSGTAANLVAANAGNRFVYTFDDSVPGEIRVHVSGAPAALVWQGDGSENVWNVATTTNWLRGGLPDAFFQSDEVLFSVTGSSSPAINLSTTLTPATLTVSNVAGYTFSGSGRVSGDASLIKQGSAALTLSTSNDFSGLTIIQGGTVNVGNVAALGLTNAGTIVTNGAAMNLNGTTLGFEEVFLAGAGPTGAGALVNSGAAQSNAIRRLVLVGDATIGGSQRWDVRGVPASNIVASLVGNGYALTKVGANQIWLANLGSIDLGNVTVAQGMLGFEGVNTVISNSATFTVNSGATLAFSNMFDADFNRNLTLTSATLRNDSGHSILNGNIAVTGVTTTPVGEAAVLDLRGIISGAGGLTKNGAGILRLAGPNTFTGNVTVSAGTLMAGNPGALGATNGTTIIASGARLDVAAFNLGAERITVTGSGINSRGAIINSLPTAQPNALSFVTLNGDTTFGGNGRWDIRANPSGSLLGAFNLTKVSDNDIWLANLGSTDLQNITINEGTVGFQGTTTMGNPASTVTVNSGGALGFYSTAGNILSKVAALNSGLITNGIGSNTFTGSISLSGSNHFETVSSSTLVLGGTISGSGFFNKAGSGTLILTGTNTTTSMARITTGTLRIGAGDVSGSYSGTISNGATLAFGHSVDVTHAGTIIGPGVLQKLNANALTLSGANSYTGLTTISAGTLRLGSATALGTTNGGTTVANGGTLDVNGFSAGLEVITTAGGGAVVNHGPVQTNALRFLMLTGNTTFGGSSRWDLRGAAGVGALNASTAFSLTKTGANFIAINSVTVSSSLGGVSVQQGTLSLEEGATGLGTPSFGATVFSNATLNLHALVNSLTKPITLQGGGKLSHSGPVSGGVNSTVTGAITLSSGNGLVENSSLTYSLLLNGAITGGGNLVLTGPGLVQLSAANNYTGGTFIAAGTLQLGAAASLSSTPVIAITNGAVFDVSAFGGGFVVGPTQTLAGSGTVLGSVIANGTVSPGASIGLLAISGNATLAGTTVMELSKSGAILANDVLNVSGTLTCGGNLVITSSGDALAANDSFHLFTPGGFVGTFANFTLPTLPFGLSWDTSTVNTDGWIRVASQAAPVIGSVNVYDNDFVFSGSGGTPGATYYVLATSEVSLPLPQWAAIATNVFDALGNFIFTNSIQSTNPQQFYQLQVP